MIRSAKPWRARSRALRLSRARTSDRRFARSVNSPRDAANASSATGSTFSRSSRRVTSKWAVFERLAVARPREADHGPGVVLGAPPLRRHERRLLVAQLVDHAVHLRV